MKFKVEEAGVLDLRSGTEFMTYLNDKPYSPIFLQITNFMLLKVYKLKKLLQNL